jgi:heme exporter protein D
MHWNSLSEFISMGGYGAYVWGSYAVTFVLLIAEIVAIRSRRRRLAQTAISVPPETRNPKLETVL